MNGIDFLFKGLIMGISVAAPVGPIGLLCINRSLNKGFAPGFVTGLGAATADAFYGLIAGFGLAAISSFLLDHKLWIQLGGALTLFYFGIATLRKKTGNDTELAVTKNKTLLSDYLSSFFLTVTNPMTILFFVAVFTGLGIVSAENNYTNSFIFVLGVLFGSGVWWLFLAGATSMIKHKISKKIVRGIDVFSGIIIMCFALYMLVGLFGPK